MGSSGSRVLTQAGAVCVAFNDVCQTYYDNTGSYSVTLTLRRAGNPVEGPTVLNVDARVAPLLFDFTGLGIDGTICAGWNAQVGDVLEWTATGLVDRGGGQTGPDGTGAHSGYSYSKMLWVGAFPDPIFNLAGSVGGWPYGNHHAECGSNPTPVRTSTWGSVKSFYR